jgi:hypothetical protein
MPGAAAGGASWRHSPMGRRMLRTRPLRTTPNSAARAVFPGSTGDRLPTPFVD